MNYQDRIIDLRRVPAGELLPNPKNWRKHPQKQKSALAGVLADVGWADAVIARETPAGLMLIDGHLRTEVAPDDTIPVLVLDVSEDEADKILLTHDPLADMAETNAAALDSLMRDVNTGSEGVQQMLAELADSAGLYPDDAKEIVEDEVPEPPKKALVKEGEIWQLGRHWLYCQSCVSANSKDLVYSHTDEFAVVTDPPYGTGINAPTGLGRSDIPMALVGDEDNTLAVQAFQYWFPTTTEHIWFGGNYYSSHLPDRKRWLIWDKDHHGMTFADAELAWTNSDAPVRVFRHAWSGLHRASERNTQKQHPTQKPVALFVWCFEQLADCDLYVDLFAGSGTSLIAAEQTNRSSICFEISPQYCDVIIERWQNLTGQKAKKVKDGT